MDWQAAVDDCSDRGAFLALATTPDRRIAIHRFTHVSGMGELSNPPIVECVIHHILHLILNGISSFSKRKVPYDTKFVVRICVSC